MYDMEKKGVWLVFFRHDEGVIFVVFAHGQLYLRNDSNPNKTDILSVCVILVLLLYSRLVLITMSDIK